MTLDINIFTKSGGESSETISLSPDVFGMSPKQHVVYLDVVSVLASSHRGTHKVKGRAEVRGGGKKPYRQKGTGSARRGSGRSPLLIGGGSIFGPTPRNYDLKVNKKVKRKARLSALSEKLRKKELIVLEDFELPEIKTKAFKEILSKFNAGREKTLFLTEGKKVKLYKSGRNLSYLTVLEARKASTYDILNCKWLIFQKSDLLSFQEQLLKK